MTPNKKLRVACGLAIALFLVGIVVYAASPEKHLPEPVRLVYKSTAGNVIFSHKVHANVPGYGLACQDCHHHPEYAETDFRACGDCHQTPPEGETFPAACYDCHALDEIEGMEVINRGEAFHRQCIQCHTGFGKGPSDCAECHLML